MGKIHLIGIGGTGLSAIARVLLERGYAVSGSDRQDSPLAEGLRAAGAQVNIGHAAELVNGAELVIRSSAVPDENVEVQAALRAGVPVLKRADYLGEMLADQMTIAVAGSHGKTTTTGMVAWMLTALNQDPGFIVGGTVANLRTNARAGKGRLFVIEADEYDHMFLGLRPKLAVVTNIEYDHPDFFATAEDFRGAFRDFADRLTEDGTLLVCADDQGAMALRDDLLQSEKLCLSYSIAGREKADVDYRADRLGVQVGAGYRFEVYRHDDFLAEVTLRVPGEHNVRNALAALAVADLLGLNLNKAALALGDYRGVGRRFEVLGEAKGVTVIDDYAHHPTEIRATLAAARECYPGQRIWVVWQPHTYSRTRELREGFANAFGDADRVLVSAVYAAREERPDDFSIEEVIKEMTHPEVRYIQALGDIGEYLMGHLVQGDVVLVLSAGDATMVSAQLVQRLLEEE